MHRILLTDILGGKVRHSRWAYGHQARLRKTPFAGATWGAVGFAAVVCDVDGACVGSTAANPRGAVLPASSAFPAAFPGTK